MLPFDRLLRQTPSPAFAVDPVVLDAAGQVIGFWTMEHLATGKVIFPFRVSAIDLYGPHLPTGEPLRCTAAIELIGDQLVRSDIDVSGADGQVWMRLVGWEDRRFDLPERFYPLVLSTRRAALSDDWLTPIVGLGRSAQHQLRCRRVPPMLQADRTFWARVWAECVLGPGERDQYRALRKPEPNGSSGWPVGRRPRRQSAICYATFTDSTWRQPTLRLCPTLRADQRSTGRGSVPRWGFLWCPSPTATAGRQR